MLEMYVIIASEVVSLLFLIAIMTGLYSGSFVEKEKTKYFRRSAIMSFLCLVFDCLSYICELKGASALVLYVINTLTLICVDIMLPLIACYMIAEMREKCNISFGFAYVVHVLCGLDLVLDIVGVLTGQVFSIQGGAYVSGPWANWIEIIHLVCFLHVGVLIIWKSSLIGRLISLYLLSFMIFPFVTLIIQSIYPLLSFSLVSCALSITLIYVGVQSKEIVESNMKSQMFREVSQIDSQTGFKNISIFRRDLQDIEKEEFIGVVCCDINGLKRINDTHGVLAGDQVIMDFSVILKRSFNLESIYRVGDDGFFVLVRDAKAVEFNGLVNVLRRKIATADFIAAIGSAYGSGKDIYALISESENVMRTDKLGYYQGNGVPRT